MPCRESPEEIAWAAEQALERELQLLRQRGEECDRERVITVELLLQLLASSHLAPAFVRKVLSLVQTAPTTPRSAGGDEPSTTKRWAQAAEINLCVARFTLLQLVPMLPRVDAAAYAANITAERNRHLRHRVEDCNAELAMLARRVADLAGGDARSAELIRAREEMTRLRQLTSKQLLANRDFSAGIPCPRCGRDLPMLPGLEPARVEVIAACIGMGQIMTAIKHLCDATRLRVVEGKRYVDCPHGHGLPEPTSATMTAAVTVVDESVPVSPYHCRTCRKPLPPFPGLSRALAQRMCRSLITDKRPALIALVQEHTGWNLKQVRAYLACPHRVPKREERE